MKALEWAASLILGFLVFCAVTFVYLWVLMPMTWDLF